MQKINKLLKDKLLINTIEVHIRIMNGDKPEDLEEYGYEVDAPIERIHQYNALTILSKLDFNREESLDPNSQSTKYLDELTKTEANIETIIEKLVAYREEGINS